MLLLLVLIMIIMFRFLLLVVNWRRIGRFEWRMEMVVGGYGRDGSHLG